MKSDIYNAVAGINRGFDTVLECLKILQTEGFIDVDYVQCKTEITEELRAGINNVILGNIASRERDDLDHYGKMRLTTETRLKSS